MPYFHTVLKEKYLYIILAVIPVIIGIAGVFTAFSSPYMGINYIYRDDKIYIESVDKGSPAAKYPGITGAEVISVAGWDQSEHLIEVDGDNYLQERVKLLQAYGEKVKYLSEHISPGKDIDIVIMQNGVETTIRIRAISPTIWEVAAQLWVPSLIAASFIIVATLVIIKKPEKIQARVFYLLSFWVAIAYITAAIYMYISGLGNIVTIAPYYMMTWGIELPCALGAAILPAAILHFCLVFPREDISPAIHRRIMIPVYMVSIASVILTVFMTRYYIYFAVLLVYLLSGMILLGYKYFKKSSPVEKTQLMLIFMGIIAPVAAEAFFDMPTIALIPLFMAFAITKYRLMDIETLFDNTLIYLIILAVFALLDVGFIYILNVNRITLMNPSDTWIMVVAIWFIMLTYLPVRNVMTNMIKTFLKREIYDTDKVMIEFQSSLLSTRSASDAVDALILAIDNTLHPTKAELLPYGLTTVMGEGSDTIRMPLQGLNGGIGVLELGPKHSGNTYTQKDVSLLRALSDMASVVIRAIEERKKAQQEKEAIAREIHDNIGHSFVMARYALMGGDNKPELKYIIDNGLAELREVLAFTEGEEQALGDFIEQVDKRIDYFRENFGFGIEITADNDDENIRVSYIIRSNLLKIIQEAVSNAVKYSKGETVTIEFIQSGNELSVSVNDNGKGFEVSDEVIAASHGLRDMKQKAAVIGAGFGITSGPAGTRVEVKVGL